ncbi:MAG: trypsin-like peptidase domain-containing protein [Bacteroidales bacterium]|nr:trypsin-like peptidase domain-containing protein [Bacteroidales bacterium]
MKKSVITVILSVAVSALAAYGIVNAANPDRGTVADPESGQVRAVNLNLSDYPDFTFAAENAVEAVVYIKVTVKGQAQQLPDDPFFRFFFGEGVPQQRDRQGSGSGVIIRQDGYIVTNNHVVAGASKVEVTLNNNKTYEASVVGTDPATDVALIKIEETGLKTLEFADSDKLRLGEWVLAIGSPLGAELRSTITAGIVSAKGRSMPNYKGEFKIESFIQTDAAVNPGNSGGALVNKEGLLVGINTAIVSTTGSYTGYSFAVPSNIVRKIVGDLIDFGSVKRARLGISMTALTDEIAKEMKLSSLNGVYIAEVVEGGAAQQAGIRKGDILQEIDGTVMKSPSAVQEKVNGYHPGDKAVITVLRDGKAVRKTVEFGGDADSANGIADAQGSVSFYGASIRNLTEAELQQAGIESGVLIVKAGKGKLAQAGAEDGFIIQSVNDREVESVQDVLEVAGRSRLVVYVTGLTAKGKPFDFGFRKE